MGRNVKKQLPDLLSGVELVSPERFDQLIQQTGASPPYLKRLLRDCNVTLHPLIEGVRQDTLDNLVRTLTNLARIYAIQSKDARFTVLESKRHTQLWIATNPADDWRNLVLLHLNTWLENPSIYPLWADLKKRNAANP